MNIAIKTCHNQKYSKEEIPDDILEQKVGSTKKADWLRWQNLYRSWQKRRH